MATAYPGGLRKRGGLLDNEDTIQATPRNPFFGGVADLLGQAYKLPEMPRMGVPSLDFMAANRNRLMDLLGVGDVQKTAEALSYGNRLGTGTGMTYRPLPETVGAAMAVAPMVAPAARMAGEGVAATGRFVAPKAGQLAEQYMVNTGGILPLNVYHGTPHTLPPTPKNPLGEFDASKIGTGEGAQAYGHGLYFAESPQTASFYKEVLSQHLPSKIDGGGAYVNLPAWATSKIEQEGLDSVISEWTKRAAEQRTAMKESTQPWLKEANAIRFEQELAAMQKMKAAGGPNITKPGSLYKVDLPDEQIAKMLDWDKPLSQQADLGKKISPQSLGLTYKQLENGNHAFVNSEGKVLGNLQKNGSKESFTQNWIENVLRGSGRDLYNQLGQGMGGGAKVSEALQQAGITGIRYLDGGSRAGGAGTSNFVVFDPAHMNIIGRE